MGTPLLAAKRLHSREKDKRERWKLCDVLLPEHLNCAALKIDVIKVTVLDNCFDSANYNGRNYRVGLCFALTQLTLPGPCITDVKMNDISIASGSLALISATFS